MAIFETEHEMHTFPCSINVEIFLCGFITLPLLYKTSYRV